MRNDEIVRESMTFLGGLVIATIAIWVLSITCGEAIGQLLDALQ